MKSREELTNLFLGEGVELGVAGGLYSAAILRNPAVSRLWSIDRWSDHHGLSEYLRAAYLLAIAGNGRCVPLRMTFEEAAPLIRPASLDFIYIDGYAHTGQDGGKTLEQWWPKLKPGGIFSGHDYAPKWRRTIEVVDAFARDRGFRVNVTGGGDEFPSWWVVKG